MFTHLLCHLISITKTCIKHSKQETFDIKRRIQSTLDNLDGIQQFTYTFKSKIFALNRYNYRICSSESINCNKSERWRTVNYDIVILTLLCHQHITHTFLTIVEIKHLYFSTNEVDMRRHDFQSFNFSIKCSISHFNFTNHTLVNRCFQIFHVNTQTR